MGRLMAIDYGKKRCGVAVTDTLQIVATGLATVPTGKLLAFIKDYLNKENVDAIIIGEPRRMDNKPSESAYYIEPFIKGLREKIPEIKVLRFDERFTSTIAHRSLLESGAKRSVRQKKEIIDTMAATIILNDYLESKQFKI